MSSAELDARPVLQGPDAMATDDERAPHAAHASTPIAKTGALTEPRRARSPWVRWSTAFALLLALVLAPWPGWGEAWSDFYCEIAGGLAVAIPGDVVTPGEVGVLFRPGDDPNLGEERVPWRVYVYFRRASDGAVQRVIENERSDYLSVATFLALTLASAFMRWRTRALWTIGLPILLLGLGLNDMNRMVLALAGWHWMALGPASTVVLSAVYAFFNGMPVVPFAVPGLLWWALGERPPRE